jgi:hypothetical protein
VAYSTNFVLKTLNILVCGDRIDCKLHVFFLFLFLVSGNGIDCKLHVFFLENFTKPPMNFHSF